MFSIETLYIFLLSEFRCYTSQLLRLEELAAFAPILFCTIDIQEPILYNKESNIQNHSLEVLSIYYNIKNLEAATIKNNLNIIHLGGDTSSQDLALLFDFARKDSYPMITDYSRLDREIIVTEKGFELGDKKQKVEIHSIAEMRKKLEEITLTTIATLSNHNQGNGFVVVNEFDVERIAIQLVFDILFDKYVADSERMTLHQYCMSNESFYKRMVKAARLETRIKSNPDVVADLELLGIHPDFAYNIWKLNAPYNDYHKKSKLMWDYLRYNYDSKLIFHRQYTRNMKRGTNGNYTTSNFIRGLIKYDELASRLLPSGNCDGSVYFTKTMDYYFIEIYKRFDLMYKLALRMDDIGLHHIDKDHFLIRRFCPLVFWPIEQEELHIQGERFKYYRPLLMYEEDLQEDMYGITDKEEHTKYAHTLEMIHIVRAKAYEVFRYNFIFASDDYDDINNFIAKHYNMTLYHEPDKIWRSWQNTSNDLNQVQMNIARQSKRQIKDILKKIENINESLFWDSGKRDPIKWGNITKGDT